MIARIPQLLAVALLLALGSPLLAWAEGPKPPQRAERLGRSLLQRLPSTWGAKTLDGPAVPPLSYQRFGHLSERGAQAIQRFVQQLNPAENSLILFRGAKTLAPRVSRMPQDPAQWPEILNRALRVAENGNKREIEEMQHCQVMARVARATWNHDRQLRFHQQAGALDQLVFDHQSSYGSELLVSATRSLSVAAGDYNMRSSDNRNRYIYVLKAPKDRLVNVHALDKSKGEYSIRPEVLQAHGNPRLKEQEIAVWIDASDCVAGIYDTVADRFVTAGANATR